MVAAVARIKCSLPSDLTFLTGRWEDFAAGDDLSQTKLRPQVCVLMHVFVCVRGVRR